MMKKIICIGILSIFLQSTVTGALIVKNENIDNPIINSTEKIENTPNSNYDSELKIDNCYSTFFEQTQSETNTETINNGKVDFNAIFSCWYSPFPSWGDDSEILGYICYDWFVENLGIPTKEYGNLKVYINITNYDGSTNKYKIREVSGCPYSDVLNFGGGFFGISYKPKPIEMKLEIESTFDESNFNNNIATFPCDYGITVYGIVNERGSDGEKKFVNEAQIGCRTDYPGCENIYLATSQFEGHDFYTLVAPKNPKTESFKYTIKALASTDLPGGIRYKTKKTDDMKAFDFTFMNFTFGVNARHRYIQNFFDNNPLLEKLNLFFQKILSRCQNLFSNMQGVLAARALAT